MWRGAGRFVRPPPPPRRGGPYFGPPARTRPREPPPAPVGAAATQRISIFQRAHATGARPAPAGTAASVLNRRNESAILAPPAQANGGARRGAGQVAASPPRISATRAPSALHTPRVTNAFRDERAPAPDSSASGSESQASSGSSRRPPRRHAPRALRGAAARPDTKEHRSVRPRPASTHSEDGPRPCCGFPPRFVGWPPRSAFRLGPVELAAGPPSTLNLGTLL